MKYIVVVLFAVFVSSCTGQDSSSSDDNGFPSEQRIVIPSEISESFYLRMIDSFASRNGLPRLRETTLPPGDLEVRYFVGLGGRFGADALILRKTGDKWSATHYRGMYCYLGDVGNTDLSPPRSGWEGMWKKAKKAGILELSGYANSGVEDGIGFLVEANLNNSYLVYAFENPLQMKNGGGKKMVNVSEVLADEFGIGTLKSVFGCPEKKSGN